MAAQYGLSHINLLPSDSFEFSSLGRFLKWATTIGRVLVVLTEFVVILAFGSRFYFDKKLNDLSDVIGQKQVVIVSYQAIEQQMRDILLKQAPVGSFLEKNLRIGNKLQSLGAAIGTGVTLDSLGISEKTLTLAGKAPSEVGYSQTLDGLKRIPGVKRISIKETNFDQTTSELKFSIQVTF